MSARADDLATVSFETAGDAVIARVAGDVDISNIAEFAQTIESGIDRTRRRHIVDLSAIAYLDSVGIRFLCSLAEGLRMRRQDLRLVVSEDAVVRSVLVLTGVTRVIPTHATLLEALEAAYD